MKILFVLHFSVFGGPHNLALQLSRGVHALGDEVVVALSDEPGNAAAILTAGGLTPELISLRRVRATGDPMAALRTLRDFPGDVRRLRRLICRQRPDVVVLTALPNPHAALAARAEGVAVVWEIVDSRIPARVARLAMPVVEHLADALMFTGDTVKRLHLGDRQPRKPSVVFAVPVDTERLLVSSARRRDTRRAWRVPEEALAVGSVANLNPMKGLDGFVRAAERVYARRSDTWFVILGAEYDTHRGHAAGIRRQVAAGPIPSERFLFLPARADLEMVYPALDVKVISSVPRSEGIPTTALEAMACGVPVVATDVGSIAEVVVDGEVGLVVPPLDSDSLAAAVLKLLDDADLRARFGTNARAHAEERYALPAFVERQLAACNAAIQSKHRRRALPSQ